MNDIVITRNRKSEETASIESGWDSNKWFLVYSKALKQKSYWVFENTNLILKRGPGRLQVDLRIAHVAPLRTKKTKLKPKQNTKKT